MAILRNRKDSSSPVKAARLAGPDTREVHLITGGGGFPGFTLGKRLAESGHTVKLCDVTEPKWPLQNGMEFIKGDITNCSMLESIFKDADCVYHMASFGMSGRDQLNRKKIEAVNVEGTKNVIQACVKNKVTRLVYTSTYNVIFGGQTIERGDESLPYLPLNKNYIEKGLFSIIYETDTLQEFLHVENLAQAHQLAGEALSERKHQIAKGQAYFISDDAPVNTFTFFQPLIEGLGYPMPSIRLPIGLIYFIAFLTEWIHYFVSSVYNFQPLLTRTEVYKTGITHTFSIEKARRELGYSPTIQNDISLVVKHYIDRGHKLPDKKTQGKQKQSAFIYYTVNIFIGAMFAILVMSFLPSVK